jgi:hypothetical protein
MKRPIVITLLVVALLFVCLGIGAVVFFAANGGFRTNNPFDRRNIPSVLEEAKTLKVDTKKPLTLNVSDDAGDVTVTGADVDTVQVKVVKTAYDSSQTRADKEVKGIQYTVEQSGNSITLKYELPESMNFSNNVNTVDFIITVPENTSVEVGANFGDINVSKVKGKANLSTDFGSTNVERIEGALAVDSQSGAIKVSQVDAGKEDIVLSTDFGEVSLEKASGQNLNIDSQSGSLKLEDVRLTSDLIISTDFGEITLNKVTAKSYDISSQSGAITVDGVKGKLKAYTDFGNIDISNAVSVTLDIHTQSGAIDFAGSLGKGPHSLQSDFGGITLTIPADSAFNVDLSTDFGEVKSDIPVTVTGSIDGQHQVGTINDGGDELKVKTQSGNITIKAAK